MLLFKGRIAKEMRRQRRQGKRGAGRGSGAPDMRNNCAKAHGSLALVPVPKAGRCAARLPVRRYLLCLNKIILPIPDEKVLVPARTGTSLRAAVKRAKRKRAA